MEITPVVLAGGSGTRLWPLSREAYPKQFLKLVGEHSLFQETILRIQALKIFKTPIIICNVNHYFICLDQLKEIKVIEAKFILEPFGRNTAPAIAMAAMYTKDNNNKSVLLVLPSDHLITNPSLFSQAITQAALVVEQNYLVTFGIKPTEPKTGYGYIEFAEKLTPDVFKVKQFIEKPDIETARNFIKQNNFYWNSGIFLFQSHSYLSELKLHSPDIEYAIQKVYECSEKNINFLRIDRSTFESCPNNSIDYAVMEKTDKAVVVPLNSIWNDLGCWTSVADANESDAAGNVYSGNIVGYENQNCYFSSDGRLIAALGLKDKIIVSTTDAVLVADKSFSQAVKILVADLKENKSEFITQHHLVYRPWGCYEILAKGKNFQVKRITVKSGEQLSLQFHHHRAEHWVVVSGVADIINGDEKFFLKENQSTYIPKNVKHRLGNSQKESLIIIEVQSGDYLGEDDIVRLDDVYDRVVITAR